MTYGFEACVFPFYYGSTKYESCTTEDNSGTEWCATSVQSNGQFNNYGNCDMTTCGLDNIANQTSSETSDDNSTTTLGKGMSISLQKKMSRQGGVN